MYAYHSLKNIDYCIWSSPKFELDKYFDRFFGRDIIISEYIQSKILLWSIWCSSSFFTKMKSFLVKGFYLNLAKEIKSNLTRIELYLNYRYAEKDTICRDTLKRYISKLKILTHLIVLAINFKVDQLKVGKLYRSLIKLNYTWEYMGVW